MKTKNGILILLFVSMLLTLACEFVNSLTPAVTPTSSGPMETKIAATIYAGQTGTAVVRQTMEVTPTATRPVVTNTPHATWTPAVAKFTLPASACWMDSKITIRAGQTVVIRASGTINTWDGKPGSDSDPNGNPGICGGSKCPLRGVGYGALIARLENEPPFFVGTTLRFTAEKSGSLHFTVNDWECDDNSGSYKILVTFP